MNGNALDLILFGVALVDVKALIVKVFEKSFDYLAVGAVIEVKAAVFVDGEVVDFVCETRCAEVFCFAADPLCNGKYQAFSLFTLCIDFDGCVLLYRD